MPHETRWWIQPPGPDESLRSVLGRAAALYECSPDDLWGSLNRDAAEVCGDVEDPSCAAMCRMARTLGVAPKVLRAHRSPDAPWRLAPDSGAGYCPECWNEDIRSGRPRMLRRSWRHVLRTHCPLHRLPLQLARDTWATGSIRTHYPSCTFTSDERQTLDLIEDFGVTLEKSLYFREPWPSGWGASPAGARSLITSVSFNLGRTRDFAPSHCVYARGNLSDLVHGPRRMLDPLRQPEWEAFRALGNPAVRRAAIWIAAWALIPDLPEKFSPGRFPRHVVVLDS